MLTTLIYISVKQMREDMGNEVYNIQHCIEDIGLRRPIWMKKNFLKLNDDKTEVFAFGSKQQMSKITVQIGDSLISPVSSVRNLGSPPPPPAPRYWTQRCL